MESNADIEAMVIRHLSGNSSAEEDRALDDWLRQSDANRREYDKIKKAWAASGAPAAKRIDVDAEWEHFRQRHFDRRKGRLIYLQRQDFIRYAAAAAVIIGLLIPGIYFSGSETYTTATGQRLQVSLSDGSEIILAGNSQLEVPRSFNWFSRNLELNGEASFEVAKNPDKAFRINGPITNTQVLGTAFKLVATQSENLIQVAEGKVAYWRHSQGDTLILTRGERGSIANGGLKEQTISSANYDSWNTGNFHFDNEPVLSVLADLQDHYVFSISNIEKYRDVDCRFSGSFENQPLEEVLDELALTMGMEYELRGEVLHITKFYCD